MRDIIKRHGLALRAQTVFLAGKWQTHMEPQITIKEIQDQLVGPEGIWLIA